ncbi:MAG: transcriptional regulator [marine bacterium B5-7]|nr:MAG: transcriptional regulator [marine bacterium B5-7]
MSISASHLRAFHAVAANGSFSHAANALHLTQPTLSGQVKSLEERFGARLFHRRRRGIELTDLGRRLYALTMRIDEAEHEINTLLMREKAEIAGRLSIGADSPYQIMPIVAEYKQRHPSVALSIQFGNSRWLATALKEGSVDVIIAPNLARRARLELLELAPDHLRVFVSRDHRWRTRKTINLEELQSETVILRESGSTTRAILDRSLKRAAIRLQQTIEVGSREAVREAVAAGLGASVIPDSERGADQRFHFIVVANAALSNTEYIACLKTQAGQQPIRSFLDCCRDFV